MFRKLVFHTRWRLAVSAVIPFLWIGGQVVNDAANTFQVEPGLYGFFGHVLDNLLAGGFFALFALWATIFVILTSISFYISEKVVGWKRVSIVVASGLGLVSFLITLNSWSYLRGDDAAYALMLSLASFPIGILLILAGRSTIRWVRAGFSDADAPAEPVKNFLPKEEIARADQAESVAPQHAQVLNDGIHVEHSEVQVSEEMQVTPSASPPLSWYERFIAGDYGLAKTYWLFGVLVSIFIKVAFNLVQSDNGAFIISVLFVAYLCALLVATWNAARKYKGLKIWAILAVLVVLSGLLSTSGPLLASLRH